MNSWIFFYTISDILPLRRLFLIKGKIIKCANNYHGVKILRYLFFSGNL
ncbi:MAG: hypothetical protein BAJALOKI2v1_830017, partial [Promethearchaeota archaeon]